MKISLPNSIKRLFVGVWLATLYLFCITIVVFSLSACLFQGKLNLLSKKTDIETSPFVEHYCTSASIKNDSNLDPIIKVLCLPITSPAKEKFFTSAEILGRYNIWKNMNDEAEKAYMEEAKTTVDLKQIEINLSKESEESDNKKYLESEKKFLIGNLETSKNITSTLQEITFKHQTDGQLDDIFVQISHFEIFFEPIAKILGAFINVKNYWSFPEPILKINLVLSMGVLGSLIFVTIEFIKEPRELFNQSFNMYFFRPFLGMIIALAMYVMVKSGQSTFFDNVEGDLSPFLISFLGIISGMLAEQAYQRIAATGTQMLNGASGPAQEKCKERRGV
jgi:hypothetical protein